MANDITYKIGAEETVSPALNKIQASVAKTSAVFSRLQGAIAGIAFGAAIQSALSYADAIADISDATEIGIANVLGFGSAVTQLGGNSEKAQNAIAKFGLTLGDALNGSLNAQNSFNDLGITLTDLARLDSQGLFDLTLKRLSELDDVTKRNRISSELFGKTLRGVDIKSLYDQYGRLTEAGRKYAEEIKRSAELGDALSAAMSKFKLEILKALSPLIEFLNNLKPEQIEAFVSAVVKIGGAAAALTTLVTVVKGLSGLLVGAAGVVLGYWALFTKGAAQATTTVAGLGIRWGGFLKGLVAATGIFAKLGQVGTFLFNTFSKTIPFLLGGLARMIPLVGAVVSAIYLVNEGIKLAFNIDPIDLFLTKVADAYYAFKEFIGLQGRQPTAQPAGPVGNAGRGDGKIQSEEEKKRAELQAAEAEKMKELQKGLDLKRQTIRQITQDFKEQLDSQIQQIRLQGNLIGKSQEQQDVMTAVAAITKEAADKTADLQKEMAKLQGVEKDQLTPTYMAQIAAIEILRKAKSLEVEEAIRGSALKKAAYELELYGIKEQQQAFDDLLRIQRELAQIGLGDQAKQHMDIAAAADERARAEIRSLEASRGVVLSEQEKNKIFEISRSQLGALTEATNQLAAAKESFAKAESIRLFDLKSEYDLQDKLLAIQRETADIGLLGIEKGYRDIARAADDSAKAAIRAEEARRGAPLDAQEAQRYYDISRRGTEGLLRAQQQLNTQARSFSTGWSKAFAEYKDAATNAATQAARLFEKFTQGIEDSLVDLVKTGKFEWRSLVADMAEELLRSQIKQLISTLGDAMGLGSLFGGASGGATRGQTASNPMYVLDVGSGGAFNITGGGGAQTTGGGGILDSIGNIFSGVKNAVGSVFSGIGTAVSDIAGSIGSIFSGGGGGGGGGGGFLDTIASGIGSLFGGFFANGGAIPAGKFGMVGERGPELIGGPAQITPLTGSTSVTYNIQAVDAASFQALVARDPGFIFAVTEAGRRSIPGGRR